MVSAHEYRNYMQKKMIISYLSAYNMV